MMGSDHDDDNHHHRRPPYISHELTLATVSSLFAVAILLIFFFICSKFLQNRRHTAAALAPSRLSAGAGGGLRPEALASLPVYIHKSSSSSSSSGGGGGGECSVCLAGVAEGAAVRMLPNCGHAFHAECVDAWLASHTTCPLCRAEAEPTAPPVDEMSLLGRGDAAIGDHDHDQPCGDRQIIRDAGFRPLG